MTIVLPATLATAAACAFINIWLAVRVGQVRRAHGVSVGDGGNMAVIARMRAHANFVEYAPFVLILMALTELAKGPSLWGWGVGAVFVVGRIAHGLGMDAWKPGRGIGTAITLIVLAVLGLYAAFAAYDIAQPSAAPAMIEGTPAA